jgi:hypothetical protein
MHFSYDDVVTLNQDFYLNALECLVGPSYVIVITPNRLETHLYFRLEATFLAAK